MYTVRNSVLDTKFDYLKLLFGTIVEILLLARLSCLSVCQRHNEGAHSQRPATEETTSTRESKTM